MKTQSTAIGLLLNWRLHLIVIVVSALSELIGIQSIPVANAKLLFYLCSMLLFFAFL